MCCIVRIGFYDESHWVITMWYGGERFVFYRSSKAFFKSISDGKLQGKVGLTELFVVVV